ELARLDERVDARDLRLEVRLHLGLEGARPLPDGRGRRDLAGLRVVSLAVVEARQVLRDVVAGRQALARLLERRDPLVDAPAARLEAVRAAEADARLREVGLELDAAPERRARGVEQRALVRGERARIVGLAGELVQLMPADAVVHAVVGRASL